MGVEGDDFPVGHEELCAELHAVRRDGVHRVPGVAVPNLLLAARALGAAEGATVHARVETVLVEAVERLGEGPVTESVRCTFGLTRHTRMRSAQERRRAAAHAQSVSVERFRRAQELELVAQLAAEIVALAAQPAGIPEPRPPADALEPDDPWVRVSTFQDEGEYSLAHLLDGARRVVVFGKTWVNLFNQHTRQLLRVVADGGQVRIVLLRPDSPAGDQVYLSELWTGGHILSRNLQVTHDRLREIDRAAAGRPEAFEVRETHVLPQFGFVAVSSSADSDAGYDRGVVQLNFAFTRVEADRPVLCLPAGSRTLAMFVAEFEAAWESARPWSETVA